MAIQVVQQPPGLGELLGTGLGQGLAQGGAQALQRGQQAQSLAQLGLPAGLSSLDPGVQREFVKQRLAQPNQLAFAQALSQLLGGQNITPQAQTTQPIEGSIQAPKEGDIPNVGVEPHQAFPSAFSYNLTPDQATKLAQLQLQKEGKQQKRELDAFKLTQAERKEIAQKGRAAKLNLEDLERLEQLEDTGKLDTPGFTEFLKEIDMDIPALLNPESQEFQKIAQTFLRDAKQYFGARVSNFELEQFLKTIPSLSQTPEGRKRVISNLKRMNRASIKYHDVMKDIIKNNDNRPPLDLSEQIDERMNKELDAISLQFKKDLQRKVPEAQSPWVTALQIGAGKALGGAGNLASRLGGAGSAGFGAGVGARLGNQLLSSLL